jgi:hypothetical protein
MFQNEWYEAIVVENNVVGNSFNLGETCVFKSISKRNNKFCVYNMKDTIMILSDSEIRTQIRSKRNESQQPIRAVDQGYINWKVSEIK